MKIDKVAFFGAGMLGSGFVKSLRRQGVAVNVWNRSFEKAQALEAHGARAFRDAADAALGASLVQLCLRDEAAVDAVLESAIAGFAPGIPVVDHTTVAVASVAPREARLRAAGHGFVHAPVFMGPPQAENAQGVMLASGAQETFDAVHEHLARLTGSVTYFGDHIERAATFKLMGNAMILAVIGGINDIFTIAQAQGLTPLQAYELFSFYRVEGQVSGRGKRMAEGDFSPLWTLEMADKDARLMQAAAKGAALPVIDAVEATLRERMTQELGEKDVAAIAARP